MRICYIGHEYHRKTASTNFMADRLEERATYFKRYDTLPDSVTVDNFDIEALAAEKFDLICVFQIEHLARRIANAWLDARLVFVPMYDGCRLLGPDYWNTFANRPDIRVINFSSTLHRMHVAMGIASFRFQYFPDPAVLPPAKEDTVDDNLTFFWQRTDRPSWETVKTLTERAPDLRFHLHLAGDPSLRARINIEAEQAKRDLTVSTWFENPSEYLEIVARSGIYISPREYEGIGMSFLEAMAAGKCVIAPDNPTMNEYIVHGVNGLLYNVDAPAPLDLSRHSEIGQAAAQYIRNGYREWRSDFDTRMEDVFFRDTLEPAADYREIGAYVWRPERPNPAVFEPLGQSHEGLPKVSVAVVCYNSETELEGTLKTILSQTYDNMEVVVVDGLSTDGTPAILDRYRDQLDICVSEADDGVYDAMNKAARLATGDYVVFINAGDYFHLPTSLEETMLNVFGPDGRWQVKDMLPDFITGNHIYVHVDGATNLHHAIDFEDTWQQLQEGQLVPSWWGGIPCHQATLTRRTLLAEKGYDLSFKITADHNFMFTSRREGRVFVHSNSILATYVGGGLSQQQGEQCLRESYRVSSSCSPASTQTQVRHFYAKTFGIYAVVDDPAKLRQEALLLRDSGLFHEEWYAMQYLDDNDLVRDPIEHYLIEGHTRNCKPHPLFDGDHYLLRNTDVYEAGVNPFLHYVLHGYEHCRPTYDWDSPTAPLNSFKALFTWNTHDLKEIESRIAVSSPAEIRILLKELDQ